MTVLTTLIHGIGNALLMAYAVWWALVFGFAISAIVQAWVPKRSVERAMGTSGWRAVGRATGLGAASSSCSYAAIAIGKSLFQKGASAISALAFQFASTNLVWELGLVLWALIGWQFAVGEFVGGLIMIVLMAAAVAAVRLAASRGRGPGVTRRRPMPGTSTTPPSPSARRGAHACARSTRGRTSPTTSAATCRCSTARSGSGSCWPGSSACSATGSSRHCSCESAPAPIRIIENVLIGPLIAVASFVCSVGNVPLAAVLWSGGFSFAGVMSFIFADLIVLPILAIYKKYYGMTFTVRITALMYVTMVLAGLAVAGLFAAFGAIPTTRPSRSDLFGAVQLDYKLVLNILGVVIFVALFGLTMRRGVKDPVCGMTVDRTKALRAELDGTTLLLLLGRVSADLPGGGGAGARDAHGHDSARCAHRTRSTRSAR